MTRGPLVVVTLLGLAVSARAGAVVLSPAATGALTAIDVAPSRSTLDAAFDDDDDAAAQLAAIASAEVPTEIGVQLRALRALTHYPSAEARATLVSVLLAHDNDTTGPGLLLRRAAVEALGLIGDPSDAGRITPLLEVEGSRDLRAAAALALRDLHATSAVEPLRSRYGHERNPQVRLAITEALRALSRP